MELIFRALFGQLLAYANLDLIEPIYPIITTLESIIDSCKCKSNIGVNIKGEINYFSLPEFPLKSMHSQHSRSPDIKIEGPDYIPVRDCVERVRTTVQAADFLIVKVRPEIQALCRYIISKLSDAAIDCCWAGGLWKGCLQKLINKWQDWKMFGIPADPAFD